MDFTCPKCGHKSVHSSSTLEPGVKLVCPKCGGNFDIEEIKRKIKEALDLAKRNIPPIKIDFKM
jgi:Peptide chain release factor 1 (eRF1)